MQANYKLSKTTYLDFLTPRDHGGGDFPEGTLLFIDKEQRDAWIHSLDFDPQYGPWRSSNNMFWVIEELIASGNIVPLNPDEKEE